MTIKYQSIDECAMQLDKEFVHEKHKRKFFSVVGILIALACCILLYKQDLLPLPQNENSIVDYSERSENSIVERNIAKHEEFTPEVLYNSFNIEETDQDGKVLPENLTVSYSPFETLVYSKLQGSSAESTRSSDSVRNIQEEALELADLFFGVDGQLKLVEESSIHSPVDENWNTESKLDFSSDSEKNLRANSRKAVLSSDGQDLDENIHPLLEDHDLIN